MFHFVSAIQTKQKCTSSSLLTPQHIILFSFFSTKKTRPVSRPSSTPTRSFFHCFLSPFFSLDIRGPHHCATARSLTRALTLQGPSSSPPKQASTSAVKVSHMKLSYRLFYIVFARTFQEICDLGTYYYRHQETFMDTCQLM